MSRPLGSGDQNDAGKSGTSTRRARNSWWASEDRACRKMEAVRCWWRDKRSGRNGQDTEWRKKCKGQWRAKEQATVRRGWNKDMERDKV